MPARRERLTAATPRATGSLAEHLDVQSVDWFSASTESALHMMCTGDADAGPVRQRVFWGVSEGLVAAMLILLAGDAGLTAVQQVITVVGLPIFIMVFLMVASLIMGLSKERRMQMVPVSDKQ